MSILMSDEQTKELNRRKEVIFIEYDGILKSANLLVIWELSQFLGRNTDRFIELDASIPINMSMDECMFYTLGTINRNPIESFTNLRGDVADKLFDTLYRKSVDSNIFLNMPPLIMYNSLIYMASQTFIDQVIIYSKVVDERIRVDLEENVGEHRNIKFITGNLEDVFGMVGKEITTYMLHTHDAWDTIVKDSKDRIVDVAFPRYHYNVEVLESGDITIPKNINLNLFVPIQLTDV